MPASGIPTNRTAISLPAEISSEIIQTAQEESAIMRLARRVTLPGRGLDIPTITSDPEAEWIAETNAKPVKQPGIGMKNMRGYTLAVILPFSNQFRRDMAGLYDNIVARLPGALARKFDATVMGAVQAPGTGFDTLANATAQSIIPSASATTYDGLVAADTDIAEHNGLLNGFGLSPAARGILLSAVGKDGRPLFVNSVADGAIPRILGNPVYYNRGLYIPGTAASGSDAGTPAIVGVAGDWTRAMYGVVEGIDISISDQATLTYTDEQSQTVTVNLWQRNMFAVRCEIEVGFIANVDVFNLLTGAIPTA
ncbi:MAG: phage major capsid protein [Clostridia bacterium]|nr:phage major capsid protein [Clostridia bacterium]